MIQQTEQSRLGIKCLEEITRESVNIGGFAHVTLAFFVFHGNLTQTTQHMFRYHVIQQGESVRMKMSFT